MLEDSLCLYDSDDNEYDVSFEFDASYTPARLHGKIEDQTPADGDSSFKITDVFSGTDSILDELDSETLECLSEQVKAWVDENGVEKMEEHNEECKAEAMIDAMDDDYDDPRADFAWDGPY